jgi:formylglycine-generating enzyme required for sulfatase activity
VKDVTPKPARSVNAKIPGSLEKIMMKLLEKDPAGRYGSAKFLWAPLVVAVLALFPVGTLAWQNPPAFVPATLAEKEAKALQQAWAAKLKVQVEDKSKLGIIMVLIPPGGAALPRPYYLGKYEVTQGEWEQVMDFNPSTFKKGNQRVEGQDTSRFPVENVSWYDSVEFCNKLSVREGLKPYYVLTVTKSKGGKDSKRLEEAEVRILGGTGYHIPTDAEWEHGCRAGTKTKYHCGDSDEDLLEYAWFDKNSEKRTHRVGEKKPNAFGLFDMHGNVREWNEEMLTNAKTGAPERLYRGGNWNYSAAHCAVSYRNRHSPAPRIHNLGLRLARVP